MAIALAEVCKSIPDLTKPEEKKCEALVKNNTAVSVYTKSTITDARASTKVETLTQKVEVCRPS